MKRSLDQMINIDEIKARAVAMRDRLTSEVITPYSDLNKAAKTILELCDEVERLQLSKENLSTLVRRLHRLAVTIEPRQACEKIDQAMKSAQHLLSPTSPLRNDEVTK